MKKISIIMPAYNEAERIAPTLFDYLEFFGELKKNNKLDFEIAIVLNACKDNTREVVERFACDELTILEFERGGKGFAIVEGWKDALLRDSDFIGFVDADGATPAFAFYDLVKNISSCDGVIANRWDKKSKIVVPQSLLRKTLSRGFNFIVRVLFLFPHRDTQCGAKIFKRGLVEKVYPKLGASEWSFDVDLLFYVRRQGARIKSIPTTWHDKKNSKINLKKTPITMFFSAVRLRLMHFPPLRFLVRFYRISPKSLKFHNWVRS